MSGRFFPIDKIHNNRVRLELRYSCRAIGRRSIQNHVRFTVHGSTQSHFIRYSFFHDAHIQSFLVLANSCCRIFPIGNQWSCSVKYVSDIVYGLCCPFLLRRNLSLYKRIQVWIDRTFLPPGYPHSGTPEVGTTFW